MFRLINKYLGLTLIFTLSFIPIILWMPYSQFSNTRFVILSLGQAFALVGSVLFSLNFILSSRIKILEVLFGGLNRVYILHHLIGKIAFVFLLLHPFFVTFSNIKRLQDITKTLTSYIYNFPVLLGASALLVMTLALIFTLFIKLPYQIWKYTHKFMGLSLFLASLHIYLIPSTTSISLPLRFYILSLTLSSMLAFTYRAIFYRYLVKKFRYKVSKVKKLNKEIISIDLVPIDKKLTYQPGQFVFVSFDSSGISKESHPFSLTSSPEQDKISFTIKSLGDFTDTLKELKKNSLAEIEGPFGYFSFNRYSNLNQIWIAGGIGITPFLSMARSLKQDNPYNIILYYVVKNPQESVYTNELNKISDKVSNFKAIYHFSQKFGRFSAEIISKSVQEFLKYEYFICGPPAMMSSLRLQLRNLGVKNSHIHSEEFSID